VTDAEERMKHRIYRAEFIYAILDVLQPASSTSMCEDSVSFHYWGLTSREISSSLKYMRAVGLVKYNKKSYMWSIINEE
jgi:hypothetical protein